MTPPTRFAPRNAVAFTITTALAAALLLAGCVANDADDGLGDIDGELVRIPSMEYNPETLTIPVGTTVTWVNADNMHEHTVTPNDKELWGSQGSGDDFNDWLRQGDTWSFTFTEPGTYGYHCIPHAWETDAGWQGQVGTIIVEGA